MHDISDDIAASQALERALHAAQIAHRAKSEFLANMSHEIRTPATRRFGGMGLGLSISKRLVERMGGVTPLARSAGSSK